VSGLHGRLIRTQLVKSGAPLSICQSGDRTRRDGSSGDGFDEIYYGSRRSATRAAAAAAAAGQDAVVGMRTSACGPARARRYARPKDVIEFGHYLVKAEQDASSRNGLPFQRSFR